MTYFWAVLGQKRTFLVFFADKYFHGSWQKRETWYTYGLRIAYKNRKGTHFVGHYSDLFLGHFKPKLVKNGQFWGIWLIKHPLLSD